MSRSSSVREKVLELDGHRCQICGADGRDGVVALEVHHVVPLGMGGSEERDTVNNGLTLCARCHKRVHAAVLAIEEFDREGWALTVTEDGDLLDVWMFHREEAERGEEITTRLTAYSLIDRDVAKDAHELKAVFKAVDPEAVSFKQYLASRGINPALDKAANLYGKSLKCEVPWDDKMSATDYRRLLLDSGVNEPRVYWHWRFESPEKIRELIANGVLRVVRCTDDDAAEEWGVGIKAGKYYGLRAAGGELADVHGMGIDVMSNTPNGDS